ncbi:hypothetical protein MRB53_037264 [Persea americana]|nr:hypothetical protein MRB53_037264 [Persea americana]
MQSVSDISQRSDCFHNVSDSTTKLRSYVIYSEPLNQLDVAPWFDLLQFSPAALHGDRMMCMEVVVLTSRNVDVEDFAIPVYVSLDTYAVTTSSQ